MAEAERHVLVSCFCFLFLVWCSWVVFLVWFLVLYLAGGPVGRGKGSGSAEITPVAEVGGAELCADAAKDEEHQHRIVIASPCYYVVTYRRSKPVQWPGDADHGNRAHGPHLVMRR